MTRNHLRAALLVAAFAAAVPARAADIQSTYTKHDYEACAGLPSPEPDVLDLRRCMGFGGNPVIWTGAPDATWIDFAESATKQIFGFGSFFVAGTTIEWRGPVVDGAIKPVAAIVRYHHGENVGRQSRSSLVAYRLAGTPCAVAMIPGATPNANEVARARADDARAKCL